MDVPKGAFQRQCNKNNPITIKILFTIKMFQNMKALKEIKVYKHTNKITTL